MHWHKLKPELRDLHGERTINKSKCKANVSRLYYQGTHCTGKTGKMSPKKSLTGKTQGILKFGQNTENLVCSSCKFPDPKGKRYFDICRENSQIVLKLDKSAKSVMCM